MRYLDRKAIERFPGNGFLALEETNPFGNRVFNVG